MSKLVHVDLENFTAFSRLSLDLSPGVNVIIGANGTGKTHLLKVLYAACAITARNDKEKTFAQKLRGVFHPYGDGLDRLVNRAPEAQSASVQITRDRGILSLKVNKKVNNAKPRYESKTVGEAEWKRTETLCTYIPVKEVLAHAPGFLSTMAIREMAFEDIYPDILIRAYLPKLRGLKPEWMQLLAKLDAVIAGKVVIRGEHFFLKDKYGELEFSLLAEGIRKLALILLLIQNGILHEGSVLFWDEPEANINPNLMGVVVDVLLELQRMGVQVILATHNYVILKEFHLRQRSTDKVAFISLYRGDAREIRVETNADYRMLDHNAISDAFGDLYDRDIDRALGRPS